MIGEIEESNGKVSSIAYNLKSAQKRMESRINELALTTFANSGMDSRM
ncbi:hypothetical protein HZY62_09595 [Maribacter polysiphoniae]|uniref:Uncharacterized protein n=1 Tax=Maribacter polysiphoniae TaxID=429344 RepID=A0ABR7VXZ5_9FLAO|nr:hypothetical protein [Maribacter polysiphoniae]MBD1260838.1 hypothetical protein [Maribacter polysiphoniae]